MRNHWIPEGVKRAGLGLMAGAMLDAAPACTPQPEKEKVIEIVPGERPSINPVFDADPAYLLPVEGGEYPKDERKARIKTLPNGETVFEDIGLTFYKVHKGDTISEIRQKLGAYPQWSYLKTQTVKLESFNIPANRLQVGMWLPIPMESADRHLTDEQFEAYGALAIHDMRQHPIYGTAVAEMIDASSEEEVLAMLYATAKQESGGLPLGQFELHRWEQGHHVFSFSLFHVLMEGPGLDARRNLNLTEGQLYHPENAAKLFLAFLVEKGFKPERYLPFDKHLEKFARFYNGGGWKKTNPDYVEHVGSYYAEALADIRERDEIVTLAKL